jgi:extradiol dioxygenase family protein
MGSLMTGLPPFHLAFPVHDLAAARAFYGGLLGCPEGRSAADWVDFDFYGHQIVAHLAPDSTPRGHSNPVDGHDVPVPHFGAVLPMEQWESLAARLRAAATSSSSLPMSAFADSRRAGDDVLPRSVRQCHRDQGCAIPPICSRNSEPVWLALSPFISELAQISALP